MKSSLWKRLTLSTLLILALSLSGCGGSDQSDVNTTEVTATEETTIQAPVTLTSGEFLTTHFAEDSGRDDYEVTLNYTVDGWRYPAGALGGNVSPAPGMKLVVTNVSISELGEGLANIAMNDFSLSIGGENFKPTWFLAGHDRSEFPMLLTVSGGDSVTHDLVFEVPEAADLTGATLNYADVISKEESSMNFKIK